MNNKYVAGLAVFLACLAIGAFFLIPQRHADPSVSNSTDLIEGTHYRVIGEPFTQAGDSVSVIEFFWYGCPHCQDFEPKVKAWLEQQAAADVDFQLSPVVWNDATKLHGAMYYIGLEADRPEELHEALFDQIIGMRQERDLNRQVVMATPLFSSHGIDESALSASLSTVAIQEKVAKAELNMRAAEVSSTPSVLVGGKYMVLNNDAVADRGIFNVVNALIEMSRNQSPSA